MQIFCNEKGIKFQIGYSNSVKAIVFNLRNIANKFYISNRNIIYYGNINEWNSHTAETTKLNKPKWEPYNIYHAIYNENGYYKFLPSSFQYPNSKKELQLVKKAIKKRTKKDEQFYYLTDINHSILQHKCHL